MAGLAVGAAVVLGAVRFADPNPPRQERKEKAALSGSFGSLGSTGSSRTLSAGERQLTPREAVEARITTMQRLLKSSPPDPKR